VAPSSRAWPRAWSLATSREAGKLLSVGAAAARLRREDRQRPVLISAAPTKGRQRRVSMEMQPAWQAGGRFWTGKGHRRRRTMENTKDRTRRIDTSTGG